MSLCWALCCKIGLRACEKSMHCHAILLTPATSSTFPLVDIMLLLLQQHCACISWYATTALLLAVPYCSSCELSFPLLCTVLACDISWKSIGLRP